VFLEDANIILVGNSPYQFIQNAVNAAATAIPPQAVIIPPKYTGTDTFTNTSNVTVLDLRPVALNAGLNTPKVVSNNVRAVSAPAASAVTAATGGVFATAGGTQISPLLPGNSVFEQTPFVVKAAGYITAPVGTYTVTIQPLLYASTTVSPVFTAAAANAIFSAAAVSCTITSASTITVPYELEAHLVGDTISGKVSGWNQGIIPTGGATLADAVTSPTIISNAPTSVAFTGTAAPLAFAFGVTIGGGAPSGPTINLGSFYIASSN
jgi:hypothetical protein